MIHPQQLELRRASAGDSRSFLQQLCELELLDREQRATERRMAAKFPVTKSGHFRLPSLPALNKKLVLELARCEFIEKPGAGADPSGQRLSLGE